MDEGDADLATFFYYLGLAAKNAAPRYRKPLPLLTPEYLLGVPVFAKRFFEQLSARLIGKTTGRALPGDGSSAIVFDNYQDVPEDSVFQEVINAGLSSVPDGVNVIVLSRSEPPPAYARLRAAGEMHLLSWEEIRLTADESNAIALLKAGRDLPGETLSQLYQTTDGWAAGLVLLMESLGMADFDYQLSRGLPREEIFAYFATELFDRSPQEDRTFLLETAFLPRMKPGWPRSLPETPGPVASCPISTARTILPTGTPLPSRRFSTTPSFGNFSSPRRRRPCPRSTFRRFRRRAAQVLEANGYGEDAVSLLCEAKEWPEAIRAILTQAPGLISQGRWQTLQGWIESLPEAVTEHQPWLLYWMGVCTVSYIPGWRAGSYFAKAFEQFKSGGDAAGSFLALSGMLDSVTFRLDTFPELDRLIAMMDELLEEYPRIPLAQRSRRV